LWTDFPEGLPQTAGWFRKAKKSCFFILIDSLLKRLFHYHTSYSAFAIWCLQAGTNWSGFDVDVVQNLQGTGLIFRMNLAKTIEPIDGLAPANR